ncbi:MAG: DEAD/DEAH box helicase [Bacteroidetes bacterium]|nr:MAG: DEAD/DEAH box helicase [Bacteroidota bacterium]
MKTKQETSVILSNLGIESLNMMQETANAAILSNKNTLLLSPTGSGKTLAFLLPILELLNPDVKTVQCLILSPARELALQIEQVWKKMATNFKVNVCYGGHPMSVEIQNLSNPPALLIGTPGRIADHLDRQSFKTEGIKILVLDEFDKSLQLGFHEQMAFITKKMHHIDKRILVSATEGIEIPKFTKVSSPVILDFVSDSEEVPALTMKIVLSDDKDKIESLYYLICSLKSESALIFCNHRDACERICEELNAQGIETGFYHGGMEQDDRERALIQFRNGSVNYLVTTDLAARGLDIPAMNHVIHYHLPYKADEFLHRNGRTARMKATGTAYLLFHVDEPRPDYVDKSIKVLAVSKSNPLPKAPKFKTLYIGGGKKNKLNKTDIVGFFSQKGKLEKDDLGIIEVKDFMSFAAVKTQKIPDLLALIKDEKMKGKKYKIEVAHKKN